MARVEKSAARRAPLKKASKLVLRGVAVAAGGTLAFILVRMAMTPKSEPFACPPGEHVGTVDYAWPHPNLFLDESGFGEALETFGYDIEDWDAPGWTACSEDVVHTVETFQRDFNQTRSTLRFPDRKSVV